MSEGANSSGVAGSGKAVPTLTNIQVAVRCRPPSAEERRNNQPTVIACDLESKTVTLHHGPVGKKTSRTYSYDKVFGMYNTQEEVFASAVSPIIDETLEGYNCTIFAYGQSGTGKTYTMEGDLSSDLDAGIVPRCIQSIFDRLEGNGTEFAIRVSFLEIYNEELQDLLTTTGGEKKLKLMEDPKKGVVCQNLEEIAVLSVKDIFDILKRGVHQRTVSATMHNKTPSRSHTIFTMKIMITESNGDGDDLVRHGQLNLVDLAGSECIGRSGARSERVREAGTINQSLLTLSRVITALADRYAHTPYRDSKLTRLLQESLGGKAKTCIIATLSPCQSAMDETMSTLEFALRAKNVKNTPLLNARLSKKAVIKEYLMEIEQLRNQLQITREKNGVYVDPQEYVVMETRISQINECEAALLARTEDMKVFKIERDAMAEELNGARRELESTSKQLVLSNKKVQSLTSELRQTQVELLSSEAVVRAQEETESRLHQQGNQLADEVLHRRREIAQLFAKIDELSVKEAERLQGADLFIDDVMCRKESLLQDIQATASGCQTDADALSKGLRDMLAKGRAACAQLQSSIDEALGSLLGRAKGSSDGLSSSLSALEQYTESSREESVQSLTELQQSIESWIVDMEGAVADVEGRLSEQQEQVSSILTAISSQTEDQEKRCTAYLEQQLAASMRSREAAESVRKLLTALINDYERMVEESTKASIDDVTAKAKNMEETMTSMIRDMLQSTLQSYSKAQSAALSFTSAATVITSDGASDLDSEVSSSEEAAKSAYNDIAHTAKTDLARNQEALADARLLARNAADALAGARAQLPTHQAALAARVSAMQANHARAATNTQTMTAQTRAAAHEALQEVGEASQGMVTAAGAALSSLTASMDAEGESIQAGLHAHFAAMDAHFQRQQAGLAGVGEASTAYGSEVSASAYASTGRTPRRGSFAPLEALVSTEDHELIKGACRLANGNGNGTGNGNGSKCDEPNVADGGKCAAEGETVSNDEEPTNFSNIFVAPAPIRRRTLPCIEVTSEAQQLVE